MKILNKIKCTVVNLFNSKVYSIVLLGLATLLIALVSWMNSLYSDKQSELLIEYNTLSSESYNEHLGGTIYYYQDLELQKNIDNLALSFGVAELTNDEVKMLETSYQLVRSMSSFYGKNYAKEVMLWDTEDYVLKTDGDDMQTTYDYINNWMAVYADRKSKSEGTSSQKTVIANYIDIDSTYYEDANRLSEEANEKYSIYNTYSKYGDRYNIAIILYSIVLFLMGIVTSVEEGKGINTIKFISTFVLLFATIYIFSVPLPFVVLG